MSWEQDEKLEALLSVARSGEASAQCELGLRLLEDLGGRGPDPVSAEYWLTRAAEQGEARAQSAIGILNLHCGVVSDEAVALGWFRRAAAQRDKTGLAHLALLGAAPEIDTARAVAWLRKEGRAGNPLARLAYERVAGQALLLERPRRSVSWSGLWRPVRAMLETLVVAVVQNAVRS